MKNQFYPTFLSFVCLLFTFSPSLTYAQSSMRANLHIVAANGSTVLMDGNLTNYDNIYSNALDMYDAWKMNNFSENFGILRNNSVLVIERRKNIGVTDTTFFKMWNMQYRNYRLQIITKNFITDGMSAYLYDRFLDTKTLIKLNDTTYINFTVNTNTGSWNPQRFEIVYSKPEVPFQFITSTGSKINNAIQLKWNVVNEKNIVKYVVEHSLNGINFTDIDEVSSRNLAANNYDFAPRNFFVTDNFYRIKAIHNKGTVYQSPVLKVAGEVLVASVFPNPIVDRSFYVRMAGVTKLSVLQLVSVAGIVYKVPATNVSESANDLVKVSLPSHIYPGVYHLKVLLTNGESKVINVRVL